MVRCWMHVGKTKTKTKDVQELDVSALQAAVGVAAPARLLCDGAGAVDKRFIVGCGELCVPCVRGRGAVVALFRVHDVKVGHDVGLASGR